jgi:hypothetical protein
LASDFISRVTWVVMGPDPALATCLRCEDVASPPAKQVPFAALEAFVNGFAAEHSACPGMGGEGLPAEEAADIPSAAPAPSVDEEPARQVEDVLSAPMPPAEKSSARRVASGAVFIDCRIHGTRPATIVGGKALCGFVDEAHLKCGESALEPERTKKVGRG